MLEIATQNGTAVLMARLVDHAGVSIRPWMVAAITYSLFELNDGGPVPIAAHVAVPLDVDSVMFDALQTGGDWTVDVCGYNFRHEIDVATAKSFTVARYVLMYEFTPVDGPRTFIRFQLKGLSP